MLFIMLLGSCNGFASPPRTKSTEVMETAMIEARTSIIGTQEAIPTLTPTPTLTLPPIQTSTTTPTFAYKQTSYGTPEAFLATAQASLHATNISTNATLTARNVQCKDGFVIEEYSEIIRYSSDQWTLFTCSPLSQNPNDGWTPGIVDYGTRYTQITKNDLSQTWIIQHSTFDYAVIDRPDALMTPVRWTADGKYLYLYPRYYPGISGLPQSAFLDTHINNLYRINLETGEFKLFLKRDEFGALDFSPDDQFLVYSEQDTPGVIHIRNMETDNDLQVKLNENVVAVGAFIWNSESTKVVFTAGYGKDSDNGWDDLSGISIFVLTPQNKYRNT